MPDPTTLTGVGVSPGVGVGPVVRVVDTVPEPKSGPGAGSPEEEFAAAAKALGVSRNTIYRKKNLLPPDLLS